MNAFTNRLDQLEARLQALIEGHIARLLPVHLSRDTLIRHMVAAMEAGAIQGNESSLLAPDIFHIQINPLHSGSFPDVDRLLAELADLIYQAGDQAGFQFLNFPDVILTPDPEIAPNNLAIMAQIRQDFPSDTLAHEVEVTENSGNIPPNAFLIIDGKQVFNLEETTVSLGRRANNDLIVDDPRVSRQHAVLRAMNGRYILFDLDSTGGTLVNGQQISQKVLDPGDVISLAGVPLVYAQDDAVNIDQTQQYIHPSPDDHGTTKGNAQ